MDNDAFDADLAKAVGKSPEKKEESVATETPSGTSTPDPVSKQPAPESPPPAEFDPESLPEPAKRAWAAKQDEFTKLSQQIKSLENDNKSLRGRLPSLQHELATLKAGAKPKPAEPAGEPSKPEQKRLEKWEKFALDYPDEAAAHEEVLRERDQEIAALRSKLDKLGDTVNSIPEKLRLVDEIAFRMEEQRAEQERQSVLNEHADFFDHLRLAVEVDDNGQEVPVIAHISEQMDKWRKTVPASIFNMLASDKPQEVGYAMKLFKQSVAAPAKPDPTDHGARVEETRKKTVAAAVTPAIPSNGVTRVDPGSLNPMDAFDLDLQKALARRA